MIGLLWCASTSIRGYMRTYMPANIALDHIRRTRRGLKLGLPLALGLVPGYLCLGSFVTVLIARGAPEWLNVLVLILLWDAMKFAAMGLVCPVLLAGARLREARAD